MQSHQRSQHWDEVRVARKGDEWGGRKGEDRDGCRGGGGGRNTRKDGWMGGWEAKKAGCWIGMIYEVEVVR